MKTLLMYMFRMWKEGKGYFLAIEPCSKCIVEELSRQPWSEVPENKTKIIAETKRYRMIYVMSKQISPYVDQRGLECLLSANSLASHRSWRALFVRRCNLRLRCLCSACVSWNFDSEAVQKMRLT